MINITESKQEIHLVSGSSLGNTTIADFSTDVVPHEDFVQLIPEKSWNRYGYSITKGVSVQNCTFIAPYSKRNGIASFDGLVSEFLCINNSIMTQSKHEITINGLQSGVLFNNVSLPTKRPTLVQALPWRIGGGTVPEITDIPYIWVIDVAHEPDFYKPIVVGKEDVLTDLRESPMVNYVGSASLSDFDLDKFIKFSPNPKYYSTLMEYLKAVRLLALDCGKLVL